MIFGYSSRNPFEREIKVLSLDLIAEIKKLKNLHFIMYFLR